MMMARQDDNNNPNTTESPLNGTWVTDYGETTLCNGSYEFRSYMDNVAVEKGIYTVSGNSITFSATHWYGSLFGLENKLYTKDKIKFALQMNDDEIAQKYLVTFAYTVRYFSNEHKYVYDNGTTYIQKQ